MDRIQFPGMLKPCIYGSVQKEKNTISIIGITGRISSGKSTVAHSFKNSGSSVLVLDVDSIAKELYEKYPEIKVELDNVFGEDIFNGNNDILFNRLAKIVFSDQKELKKLNRIMFPHIRLEVKRLLRAKEKYDHIIIDAAVLFGAKLDLLCEYIIFVDSSVEKRRVLSKNKNLSDNDIELKIKGQYIELNNSRIDYTIINDEDKKKLYGRAGKILRDIENKEKIRDAKEQV